MPRRALPPFLTALLLLPSLARADKPDYPGIWGIWGSPLSREGRPWYKGHVVTVGWDQIEPSDNHFVWEPLDQQIADAASKDLYVMAMVYTGERSPAWLYQRGVPAVKTDFAGYSRRAGRGETLFPFYLDGHFRNYFKRMIRSLAAHLDKGPPAPVRRKIIVVQCPVGASGDPHPYKVAGDPGSGRVGSFGEGATAISPPAWLEYQKEMFRFYYDAFERTRPRIHCLFNTISSEPLHFWTVANLPGFWAKTNRIGDRYQNSGEAAEGSYQVYLPKIGRQFQQGRAIRSRSEMDMTDRGWFEEAPLWNMYWTQLWGLHNGQDLHNQMESDLQKKEYYPAFEFYSAYAGYKDPRDSHGAWCALRDGLDCADTRRFPETRYGAASQGRNKDRYLAIARAFQPFGARQSESGCTPRTNWEAMDDVAWQIYQGNYELYLRQHDPNGTSQGLWRQGPQSQPYGRFARRFDHASGRDAMYFDLDDGFFFGRPLNGQYEVRVRVVYLDSGRGQWALQYDAVGNARKTALTVRKTGSGMWKEAVATIRDGYFGNRCPRGADLMLFNTDDEDDTFHTIELTRRTGDRKGFWGSE